MNQHKNVKEASKGTEGIAFPALPENVQLLAAETLKSLLTNNNSEEEQAIFFARSVKTAFLHLYKDED